MSVKIKICGLKEKSHALAAAGAGADFVGLVMAPSRRQVTVAQAREIVSAVKEYREDIRTVGVFVNMPVPAVNRMARDCGFDWVQLSGDETWAYCQQINYPVIKVAHVKADSYPEEIFNYLLNGDRALAGREYLYILDSRTDTEYGGTGETFDWGMASGVAKEFPIILAGGLSPENVAAAVSEVAPWGVDVSSGVEHDGVKSPTRIKAFIREVRRADKHE